jgi:predicted enzyme related to lactoylglutathione lyase
MDCKLNIKLKSFTIDCLDPKELAEFYLKLLNWEIRFTDEEYTLIYPPDVKWGTFTSITFQKNPEFTKPVWPGVPDAQQQMAHLDLAVNDIEKAVQHAVSCGAKIANVQFSDDWTVMIDPEGHPFCLIKS